MFIGDEDASEDFLGALKTCIVTELDEDSDSIYQNLEILTRQYDPDSSDVSAAVMIDIITIGWPSNPDLQGVMNKIADSLAPLVPQEFIQPGKHAVRIALGSLETSITARRLETSSSLAPGLELLQIVRKRR